jgi:RHH-type proline utilization regulon transcriptional repressor/proline dehydrogenase/delta 1-pyrroline-5-carboxylate dehydrogenase
MKAQRERITTLTAYDHLFAQLLDEAGIDVILVGDSVGTVMQGRAATVSVTMDQMVYHTELVSRGCKRALVVGDPSNPSTDIGPVIDADAAARIKQFIEIGSKEGKLELQLPVPEGLEAKVGLPYVGPAIISGIRPEHRLANDEIFGPVLAVIKVKDFEEALAVANGTAYKLTGGIYSRKPAHLERAKREYRVGNLYLNRGITGALVGRQPFGGFGMSGLGSKAGGGGYLEHFVVPRALCENTMRRGFAPSVD